MTETIETVVYRYDELEGKAKERAKEWLVEQNHRHFDSDDMDGRLKEMSKDIHGIVTKDMHWSLSYCQGDGVAWYGYLDLDELAKLPENPNDKVFTTIESRKTITALVKEFEELNHCVGVTIEGRNHRYHHWNSMDVQLEIDNEPWFDQDHVKKELSDWLNDLDDNYPENFINACEEGLEKGDWLPFLVFFDWCQENGLGDDEIIRLRVLCQGEDVWDKRYKSLRDEIVQFLKKASRDIERRGYDEIEYITESDEQIDHMMEDNDYKFTEDGEFFE